VAADLDAPLASWRTEGDGVDMSGAAVVGGITDTVLDYAEAVDTGDVDRWVDLFCLDGVFDEGHVVQGHEALAAQFTWLLSHFSATAHHMSNIRVRPTGDDTAGATSYVYAWHRKVDGGDFELWGRYVDSLRFERERWRFAHRRVEMFGSRGLDVRLPQVPRRDLH
jgi:ketosteroid isomerase-like protein